MFLNFNKTLFQTYQRRINRLPFKILFGTKNKQKEDLQIIIPINSAVEEQFMKESGRLRNETKSIFWKFNKKIPSIILEDIRKPENTVLAIS